MRVTTLAITVSAPNTIIWFLSDRWVLRPQGRPCQGTNHAGLRSVPLIGRSHTILQRRLLRIAGEKSTDRRYGRCGSHLSKISGSRKSLAVWALAAYHPYSQDAHRSAQPNRCRRSTPSVRPPYPTECQWWDVNRFFFQSCAPSWLHAALGARCACRCVMSRLMLNLGVKLGA